MNALIPFSFEKVRLKESCWIEGKPYFTGRAIGEWLEVKYPDRYVHKIVERNPHILQFSTEIDLPVIQSSGKEHTRQFDEGGQTYERIMKLRVYDPIGFQLIINKSNQPKALAFQVAVAHLVVAYMRGELAPVSPFENRLSDLINLRPQSRRRAEAVRKMASEMGLSTRTIYTHLQRIEKG